MVHSFLKANDIIIDFNEDGCVTSCFFNDLIVHEGANDHHIVVLPNDNSLENCSKACMYNIQSTSSKIKLEFFSKDNLQTYSKATTLLLDSHLNKSFQDAFLELCSSLDDLRLVIFNTDSDATELLHKVNTVLTIKQFYPHVVGKYTVYVKNVKTDKIKKINKTPQSSHVIIGFLSILQYFWK